MDDYGIDITVYQYVVIQNWTMKRLMNDMNAHVQGQIKFGKQIIY